MIEIKDKSRCCGCSACVEVCPVKCISFNEDDQGFRYPEVDKSKCINCHLCEKACPCINESSARSPIKIYAAINSDEDIRKDSSSGGIFTIIANSILQNNGVVFGARFDENWEVIHGYTESEVNLDDFRRSKYVQSLIGTTFKDVEHFLKKGRFVLFSGTPCQIHGLKRYLRKEYANLFTVEVVCHAVPSPKIWRQYICQIASDSGYDLQDITFINFRDKTFGWKDFSMLIKAGDQIVIHERVSRNLYLSGFINNLFIRPSCFECPSKGGRSGSDFSLADFWAINQFIPNSNDNRGTTLLYVNSERGLQLLKRLKFKGIDLDASKILNIAFSFSTKEKYPISLFWELYSQHGLNAIRIACKKIKPNPVFAFIMRAGGYLKRKLK